MSNFDMTPPRPQRPQFRDPNGRLDWLQIMDMIVPGNVYNSHTNQFRPLGIAQGMTGIPVDTAYGIGSSLGGAFRGGADFFRGLGRGGRRYEGNPRLGPTPYRGSDWSPPDFAGQDNWGTRQESPQQPDPNWRMPGVRDAVRPGGFGGASASSQRGLGAAQRFGSQLAMADYLDAVWNRGGALMER